MTTKPVGFALVNFNPPIVARFRKYKGAKTKRGVSIVIARESDYHYLASTGFDARIAGVFSETIELRFAFSGRLWRERKQVGDLSIGKGANGRYWMSIRLNGEHGLILFGSQDIADLKALMCRTCTHNQERKP